MNLLLAGEPVFTCMECCERNAYELETICDACQHASYEHMVKTSNWSSEKVGRDMLIEDLPEHVTANIL